MIKKTADTRVVVAMSGGVDSSVAAALLKQQGYEVVGMMMRLWSDDAMGGETYNRCCTPAQMADARRIANQLDIPFYVLDTKDVFRNIVVQYFLDGHRAGVTPNPCMECNRHIRFEYLLNNALAMDADYLATGHYARIDNDESGLFRLRHGVDQSKDQSYVLSVMGQQQLSQTLFPVGEYPKNEVRRLAAEFGLNVESKKDSQDLCFLGGNDYREFLNIHIPEVMQSGPIVRADGTVIGEHKGLSNYTIGQRKGLGLHSHEPLYVISMNPYRNALIVGAADELGTDTLIADEFNWVSGSPPSAPLFAQVKIRYKAIPSPAWVDLLDDGRVRIRFDIPQRDITPGQGAVVYDGDICLGGGIIQREDVIDTENLPTESA